MSSLNALNVAIEAAERKRDAARTAMQERQRAQQAAQAQMDQLQGYVLEMQARWGAQEGLAVQPEVMHHQYQFMERLQHAIGLQTRVVADQDIRLETSRQALLAAELRVTSLQKVVQAAGRVIRTTSDQGVVYLLDDRFTRREVRQLLPSWWQVERAIHTLQKPGA